MSLPQAEKSGKGGMQMGDRTREKENTSWEKATATFTAVVDFPSLGTELEITNDLQPSWSKEKEMLVRIVLYASTTAKGTFLAGDFEAGVCTVLFSIAINLL